MEIGAVQSGLSTMISGELWRVGVLVVGGEVGDFGEQQGDKGSLLAALDRSGRPWFALAPVISGLRRRSSSAVAKTANSPGWFKSRAQAWFELATMNSG